MKISLIPLSLHHVFISENFRFPFSYKIVGNLLDKLRKVYMNGTLEIFSPPQVIENSRQCLLLRADVLLKTVVSCPCNVSGS